MTERGVGENEAPGTLRESTGSQEEGSQSVGQNQPKATELEQVQRPISGPQSYQVNLSPSQGHQDEATQLAGMVTNADVSPTTEARLLGGLLHGESSPAKGSSPTGTGTSPLDV